MRAIGKISMIESIMCAVEVRLIGERERLIEDLPICIIPCPPIISCHP